MKTKKQNQIAKPDSNAPKANSEVLNTNLARLETADSIPQFSKGKNGKLELPEKGDLSELCGILDATASSSFDFANHIVGQLQNLSSNGLSSVNAGVAFLHGLKPRDEIEALLMSQMFAIHTLIMDFSARVFANEDPEIVDRNANRVAKLTGRFADHMGALQRHRGYGPHQVNVGSVNVGNGGQAVVGNFIKGTSNGENSGSTP